MAVVDRRGALSVMGGLLVGVLALGVETAEAQRRPAVRRARRRVRRRVRRRIRRHVIFRMVAGRRLWVAPLALAIGWEMVLEANRVVVVTDTRFVERSGARVEVVVVHGADGKSEELEIVREDTEDNRKDLDGSVLPDSDKTTPATEREEEVEVDD